MYPLWYCISESARHALRGLLPKRWKPPPLNDRETYRGEIESPEELEHMMQEAAHPRGDQWHK